MTALNRKLLRDVWHHRGQMLSIAVVVAVGIMTVLTMRGTYESLALARDSYYRSARFPDVWVQLERAPESLRRRLEGLPGVAGVETRVTLNATLDVPGLDAPAFGLFVSIPDTRRSMLGDIHLRSGRYIAPGRLNEVLVSVKFAAANGLGPGDTLRAVINGRLRDLEITGTAIAPEHTYAVPPGAIFPEDERYGIVWMARTALAAAYDMDGAFNEVLLTLAPGAAPTQVHTLVDRLLKPYGGLGAYGRDDQVSYQILEGELQQNRAMGTAVPAMFLAVAAFLLNLVLGRLIATQRTEVAVLKAFGYTNVDVGRHYLRFAMVAVSAGAALGIVAGIWLGGAMTQLYGDYFDFPDLRYRLSWRLIAIAGGVSLLAAATGALGAVRRATRLQPAEAMRPEPPTSFQPGVLERLGLGRVLPAAGRMILRHVERHPVKSALSAVGVAFSVAILVVGMFMFDGVNHMIDLQFRMAQREDLSLTFNRPLSAPVRYELAHLEGVSRVEPFRTVPVRVHAGHREREVGITGVEAGARLRRIVTADGGVQTLPPTGLVVSAVLAGKLHLAVGDVVDVEVLEGARRTERVLVAGIVEDFLGVSAYMQLDALQRLTRDGRGLSGAYLRVADAARADLNARLKRMPAVASVASPDRVLESFETQLSDSLFVSVFFLLGFSGVIAVAVVYNGARIGLSERGRELASLRVLGFTRGEVAVLLLGEQAIVTVAAIPLGWVVGYLLAAALAASVASDTYRIPLVVSTQTYVWSAVIPAIAAVVSGWLVRRRLDRMDLIAVLKTRE